MRMTNRRIWGLSWACLAMVACPEPAPIEIVSDFVLTLEPLTLDDQDPFSDGRDAALQITWPDGVVDVIALGSADGERTAIELPPLLEGTRIALAVEEAGGADDEIDRDLLVAWGEVVVDEDLDTGEVALPILVTEVGRLGTLGRLPKAAATLAGALAAGPGGEVFLFGGHDPATVFTGVARNDVRVLSNLELGEWSFTGLDFELPLTQTWDSEDMMGRAGLSATSVVGKADAELIFVFGGRANWSDGGGNTGSGALFDPVAREVVWQGDGVGSRSEHDAVLLDDGRVFLAGGLQGAGVGLTSWEIFDPRRQRFDVWGQLLDNADLGARSTTLGARGAMVCGGLDLVGSTEWHPVANCTRVSLDEQVSALAPLPVPRGGHAMVTLSDGRVLVVGGFSETVFDISNTNHSVVDATDDAFLYDPDSDTWDTVGLLTVARAHAAAIAMPDGTAVVVGGTAVGHAIFGSLAPAVQCPERFDPETLTFEALPCLPSGSGADPRWAEVPGEGVVVLEGWTEEGPETLGGRAFGWVGLGPR